MLSRKRLNCTKILPNSIRTPSFQDTCSTFQVYISLLRLCSLNASYYLTSYWNISYSRWYMDTVSLLIDSGSSDQISPVETEECKITDATAIHIVQLIMPALYLGHYERVIFLAKKFESLQEDEKNKFPIRATLISFYHGLAVAGVYRRNQKSKPLLVLRNAISTLSKVSEVSSWNFRPKLLLLQAEMHSIKNKKSDSMYDDAIKAAQSSKFVHDEALACELAGKHFGRCKNLSKALLLYKQAERCYRDWGSEKKANQMKELIGNLS